MTPPDDASPWSATISGAVEALDTLHADEHVASAYLSRWVLAEADEYARHQCTDFLADMRAHPRIASFLAYALLSNCALVTLLAPESKHLSLPDNSLVIPPTLRREPQFLAYLRLFTSVLEGPFVEGYVASLDQKTARLGVVRGGIVVRNASLDAGSVLCWLLKRYVELLGKAPRFAIHPPLSRASQRVLGELNRVFQANLDFVQERGGAEAYFAERRYQMTLSPPPRAGGAQSGTTHPLRWAREQWDQSVEGVRTLLALAFEPAKEREGGAQEGVESPTEVALRRNPYLRSLLAQLYFFRLAAVQSLLPGQLGEAFLVHSASAMAGTTLPPDASSTRSRRVSTSTAEIDLDVLLSRLLHPSPLGHVDAYLLALDDFMLAYPQAQELLQGTPHLCPKCVIAAFGVVGMDILELVHHAVENGARTRISPPVARDIVHYVEWAFREVQDLERLFPQETTWPGHLEGRRGALVQDVCLPVTRRLFLHFHPSV